MAGGALKFDIEFNAQTNADQATAQINNLLRLALDANEEVANAAKSAIAQIRGYSGKVETEYQLNFKTNSAGLKEAQVVQRDLLKGWDDIEQKIRQETKAQAGSVASLKGQLSEATQVRNAITRTIPEIDMFGRKVAVINPLWDEQNKKVQSLSRELGVAGSSNFWQRAKADLGFGGIISAANGVSQLVDTFQSISIVIGQVTSSVNALINSFTEIQSFQMSFEAIGEGASGGVTAFKEASNIALRLGVDLESVRNGFKQLSPVVLKSGGDINDVSNIVEALSTRFAAFGKTGEESKRIMNGITQAFAKGKLMSEELTQQISEFDPAFKTDLAAAIGVSVAALEVLVKNGEITSQKLIEILPKMAVTSAAFTKLGTTARDAADAFSEGGVTITQVVNKFKTLETLSFEQLGQSLRPFLEAVLKAQAGIIDFFNSFSQSSVVATFGTSLGVIVQILGQVVVNMLNAGQSVLLLIKPFLDLANFLAQIPLVIDAVAAAFTVVLFAGLQKAIGGLGAIKQALMNTVTVFPAVIQAVTNFATKMNSVQQSAAGIQAPMTAISTSAAGVATSMAGAGTSMTATSAKIKQVQTSMTGLSTAQTASVGSSTAAGTAVTGYGTAAEAARARVTALGTSLQGTTAAMTQQAAAASAGAAGIASYLPPLTAASAGTSGFANAMKVAGDSSLSAATKTEKLSGTLKGLSPGQVGDLANAMLTTEKNTKAAAAATPRLANGFGLAAAGAGLLKTELGAMAVSMLKFEAVIAIFRMLGSALDFMGQATAKNTAVTQAAKTSQEAFNEAVKNYGPAASTAAGGMSQVKSGVEEFRAEVDQLGQSSQRTSGLWSDLFDTNMGAMGGIVNSIQAINKELENTPQKLSQADQILGQYNSSMGEFDVQNIKALAGIKGMIKAQDDLIAALKAEYAAKKQAAGEKVSEAEQDALDALQRRIEAVIGVRDQLNAKAIAVGIDQASLDSSTQGLDVLKEKMDAAIKKAEELAEIEIETIKARVEVETAQIDEAKKKLQELYDLAKESLAVQKEESSKASEARMAAISKEKEGLAKISETITEGAAQQKEKIQENAEAAKQAIDTRLAAELAAIDQVIAKENAAHASRMASINEYEARAIAALDKSLAANPFSATSQLAKLDALEKEKALQQQIAELRKKGDTEGAATLEKRAQLEKEAAEEQKRVEEEKQKIAAQAAQQRQQAEAAHAEEMAKLEEERQKKEEEATKRKAQIDLETKEKVAQIEAKAAEEQKAAKEASAAIEEKAAGERAAQQKKDADFAAKEKDLEKTFKEEMKALDEKEREARKKGAEEIKGIEDSIKAVKEDAAKVLASSNEAAEQSLNNQLAIAKLIVAEYAKMKPPGKAGGGPVSGGSSYTVNEFGKEAFLSAAGRLSMINTPSWGTWRAPSSGTVIPAHLTRLLSIPSGGINLNQAPATNVGRFSRASSPFGAVLSALRQPTNGMTSEQAGNITATQAQQAVAIGKLSRSVRELSRKDWNVNVSVKNGGSTNNYLHTLNTLR